jgi:hypothetical protein
MAAIVWILPIQMFRTTAILVIAGALGFAVLRHQVAAEVPDGGVTSPDKPEQRPQPETINDLSEEE